MSKTEVTGCLGKMSKRLRRAGFTMQRTGSGHVLLVAPDGTRQIMPLTPGNRGAQEKSMMTALRKGSFANSQTRLEEQNGHR